MSRLRFLLAAFALLGASASAQVTPDQVLVVVNDTSAMSQAIGAYYAQARAIPNTFHLPAGTSDAETISRSAYNTQIRDPLREFFEVTRPDLKNQILFIVLTKGVPNRVANTSGSGTTASAASVDSELTLLFTDRVGDNGHEGRILNPFYGTYDPPEWRLPRIQTNMSYMVFRLEGYDTDIDPDTGVPADIKRLIDDSLNPADSGQVLLDATSPTGTGNNWLVDAAAILGDMQIPFTLDTTSAFQKNHPDLLGYCSWGSNDPSDAGPPYYGEVPIGSGDFYPGFFKPGAVTSTYVSTSARTFLDGNQNYGQSLIADLIDVGATAGNGHVYEPFLDAVARPHYLFPRYFQGFQLGTAYYHSILWLSWMNIVVCDPLATSPLTGVLPPEVHSTSPARLRAGERYEGWRVRGENFTSDVDVQLFIGDDDVRKINVLDTQTVEGKTRLIDPGVHDVRVETFMGSATLTGGLIGLPALQLLGTPDLGAQVTVRLHGETGNPFVTLYSLGTAMIDFPPYGTLYLDPSSFFGLLLGGLMPGDEFDLTATIPNDQSFSGLTVYFQAIEGPDLQTNALLTNLLTLAIP